MPIRRLHPVRALKRINRQLAQERPQDPIDHAFHGDIPDNRAREQRLPQPLLLLLRANDQRVIDATVRGAGGGIERLGQAVDEGDGPPVRRSVHGVDGVRDEEPFAQLEVVRCDGQEGVEQFGRLQHARCVVVRVAGLGGVEGREGVV